TFYFCTNFNFKELFQQHVSISSTFYKELLRVQIPKAQKRLSSQAAFCAFGICKRKSSS
ncbi:hypothetical protein HMI54_012641, partial [Coelomomyces lativittatus]